MPPDGYAADQQDPISEVLRHLADIGAGRTSITEEELAHAPNDLQRELLVGLLTLHEDLQYERGLRTVAEQQSDRLVSDLRAAVAARDEFLSIASHELRTPLSTLKLQTAGLMRWLSRASLPDYEPVLMKHFAAIDRQVDRLERLTAELLDVSRITSGRLELHPERLDFVPLVREIVERFRGDLSRGAPAILFETDDAVIGDWDPFRIDQIVSNLLANALRYGEGRPVHVSVRAVDGQARIAVRDEGIGIDPEHTQRIFERFERAVSSAHYGGLGLGLWITRQLVDAHSGRIDVESRLGQGATFTVTLPLPAETSGEAA